MTAIKNRIRIVLLFGGRSPEHDVSVLSATNVIRALDSARYEVLPVFITREGLWLLSNFDDGTLAKPSHGTELCLIAGGLGRIMAIPENAAAYELPKIDALFPVLHGLHGEDGAVQGLAEVARVPLIGCGLLGSAAALDKDFAKRLLNEASLPTAKSVTIHQGAAPAFEELSAVLGLPFFIKPARQGSSIGVGKVATSPDYQAAINDGFSHDNKLLAETFIRGREIEFAVLENVDGSLFVSRAGEIIPAETHGFYSYDAKYIDENGATVKAPADLPAAIEEQMRSMAAKAFKALGCDSMARVDFFLNENMQALVNEVNTIPGFTDISMYSKVMSVSGVSYPQIIDRLVAHGLARGGR